jgi:hypothetical protein
MVNVYEVTKNSFITTSSNHLESLLQGSTSSWFNEVLYRRSSASSFMAIAGFFPMRVIQTTTRAWSPVPDGCLLTHLTL